MEADRGNLKVRRVEPAYRQVARQLREQILEGRLASGERLPNETALSALFGVSRSTVREALSALTSERLVTTSRGVNGGSFIAHPEPEHISDYLETGLGLLSGTKSFGVNELLEARELLEVPTARLAAVRRTEEDIRRLRMVLSAERSGRPTTYEDHRNVHVAILAAAHNKLLEIMTQPVATVLRMRLLRQAPPEGFWDMVDNDHEDIIRCIEQGDPDGTEAAMRSHLEHLRSGYEHLMEREAAADGRPVRARA